MNAPGTRLDFESKNPASTVDTPSAPRRGLLLTILAIIVVAVAGGFFALRGKKQAPAAAASPSPATAKAEAPVDVLTAAAIRRSLPSTVEVVGSLAGDEEVIVSAQVAGEIASLNIDFGTLVKQGQVIGQIDKRDAILKEEQAVLALKQTKARLGMKDGEKFDVTRNADVQQARAQLDWTSTDLERASRLLNAGDVPRAVYDQALTQKNLAQARYQAAVDAVNQQIALVQQQEAAINLARKTVGDTIIKAPISGAVKEKVQARGAYVPVGGKLATIVKTDPLRLRADIPETSAAAVRIGQTITLKTDAFPGRTFTGRVARIGASLNETTRALTVEAQVANPGTLLRPGMFAKAQLVTNKNATAVLVPQKAIVNVAGLNKVYVAEQGKAVEREVKLGITDGELVEIMSGVNEGDTIITSNTDKLQKGTPVNVRRN